MMMIWDRGALKSIEMTGSSLSLLGEIDWS